VSQRPASVGTRPIVRTRARVLARPKPGSRASTARGSPATSAVEPTNELCCPVEPLARLAREQAEVEASLPGEGVRVHPLTRKKRTAVRTLTENREGLTILGEGDARQPSQRCDHGFASQRLKGASPLSRIASCHAHPHHEPRDMLMTRKEGDASSPSHECECSLASQKVGGCVSPSAGSGRPFAPSPRITRSSQSSVKGTQQGLRVFAQVLARPERLEGAKTLSQEALRVSRFHLAFAISAYPHQRRAGASSA
jgi:hypothetical protein